MLKIHYFAALRETLGSAGEQLTLPQADMTVAQLVAHLMEGRGEAWHILNDSSQVLVAVDQTIADRTTVLSDAQEVAFFPPMTGG